MKRNSTRFLALFLTAAMSVTPAVAAFGENQENSDQIPAISLAPQPSEMPEIYCFTYSCARKRSTK